MKKIFLFFIVCMFLFSCSKKSIPAVTQQTTGYLYYSDPAADGSGLYFLSDKNQEMLFFYTEDGDQFSNYEGFKDSVGKHLRLSFLDEGRKGCPFCQVIPSPQFRIIKLISMVKD